MKEENKTEPRQCCDGNELLAHEFILNLNSKCELIFLLSPLLSFCFCDRILFLLVFLCVIREWITTHVVNG